MTTPGMTTPGATTPGVRTPGVTADPAAEPPPVADLGPVHLIGIGGAGMSGIARLLLARGVPVSGSDARSGAVLEELAELGARVAVGHDPANLPPSGTVVVSTAVRAGNPELLAARERGFRELHRSQALAALMRGRRGVAVAGTHGKTTTTAMLAVALTGAGLDPSYLIGGSLTAGGGGAHEGAGQAFVVEADESDGSFLVYRPDIAVITNVEPDHLDHYGSAAAVTHAFTAFCGTVRPGGLVVACGDDPGAAEVLAAAAPGLQASGVEVLRYGVGAGCDVRLTDLAPTPDGVRFGLATDHPGVAGRPAVAERAGPVTLRVPGVHNALNAAAAWCVSRHLGADGEVALRALADFGGTRRRFEVRGESRGVRVVDDYAHHPTEVAAVLRAARSVAGGGRVIAVFQPHLFSRTRLFAADFGAALGLADQVLVLDVYAAREDPEPGVTGALIADRVDLPADAVRYLPDAAQVPAEIGRRARSGDLVLTIGAGDVTALGSQILTALDAGGTVGLDAASAGGPVAERRGGGG
jgi:UDP-N-acetylmuramate--alanine ligase